MEKRNLELGVFPIEIGVQNGNIVSQSVYTGLPVMRQDRKGVEQENLTGVHG